MIRSGAPAGVRRARSRRGGNSGVSGPVSAAALAALVLTGCGLAPAHGLDRAAAAAGFHRRIVEGAGFRHLVYENRPPGRPAARLTVYLDGDGTPWLGPGSPAPDPTPREPLALRLMALDPGPALYLGRPCYGGLADEPGCSPWLWTHGRYSEPVVASLAAAIARLASERRVERLALVGYSGGGTLAMLVAERLPRTGSVVTLAANLDVAAWAALHGYSPLRDSLNPARRPPLPDRIRQRHWAGGRDRNVPPALIRDALSGQTAVRLEVLADADHSCCWEALWGRVLAGRRTLSPRLGF